MVDSDDDVDMMDACSNDGSEDEQLEERMNAGAEGADSIAEDAGSIRLKETHEDKRVEENAVGDAPSAESMTAAVELASVQEEISQLEAHIEARQLDAHIAAHIEAQEKVELEAQDKLEFAQDMVSSRKAVSEPIPKKRRSAVCGSPGTVLVGKGKSMSSSSPAPAKTLSAAAVPASPLQNSNQRPVPLNFFFIGDLVMLADGPNRGLQATVRAILGKNVECSVQANGDRVIVNPRDLRLISRCNPEEECQQRFAVITQDKHDGKAVAKLPALSQSKVAPLGHGPRHNAGPVAAIPPARITALPGRQPAGQPTRHSQPSLQQNVPQVPCVTDQDKASASALLRQQKNAKQQASATPFSMLRAAQRNSQRSAMSVESRGSFTQLGDVLTAACSNVTMPPARITALPSRQPVGQPARNSQTSLQQNVPRKSSPCVTEQSKESTERAIAQPCVTTPQSSLLRQQKISKQKASATAFSMLRAAQRKSQRSAMSVESCGSFTQLGDVLTAACSNVPGRKPPVLPSQDHFDCRTPAALRDVRGCGSTSRVPNSQTGKRLWKDAFGKS